MTAGNLFDRIVTTDRLLAATGGEAWLTAMLDAEVALARAQADTGVIPHEAAAAIEAASRSQDFDVTAIAEDARLGGNPVIPLVETLRTKVAEAGKDWVHWGATSQDILDTAAVLVARRSGRMILEDLARLAAGCATLADEHRDSLMTARTLLQPALPTTFGAKAAGWLFATIESRSMLAGSLDGLPAQLGGAGGTLASLGSVGPAVVEAYSARLGLKVPLMPWHAVRTPLVALSSSLAIVAGTSAKIAVDVALLMQAEVAEASEPAAPGRGASSTLPHKRNPVGAAAVGAAAKRCAALAGSMFGSLSGEHERSLVAWPVEWQTLGELLALAGGAVARSAETVHGLEVDVTTMKANLTARAGALLAENVSLALTGRLGRQASRGAVAKALAASADSSVHAVAAALLAEPDVAAASTLAEVSGLLDPGGYLGSASVWIDRVLSAAAAVTAGDETGVSWPT